MDRKISEHTWKFWKNEIILWKIAYFNGTCTLNSHMNETYTIGNNLGLFMLMLSEFLSRVLVILAMWLRGYIFLRT